MDSLLPRIEVPIYSLTLPSNGKKIKYRPFTVKEKKLFLLARESGNIKDVVETVKQVINNCVLDKIDVDNMAIIDIEMLFVNLRARSIGETIDLEFECSVKQGENQTPCGGRTSIKFNLLGVEVEKIETHSNKIELTPEIGVVLKYPTFGMSQLLYKEDITELDVLDSTVVDCIDYIYTKDKIYYAKDHKREELIAWFEDISEENFNKIRAFFQTAPKIVGKSHFECNKCGHTEDIKLQGIEDFFG